MCDCFILFFNMICVMYFVWALRVIYKYTESWLLLRVIYKYTEGWLLLRKLLKRLRFGYY